MRIVSAILFFMMLMNAVSAKETIPPVRFLSETRETDYTIGDIATQRLLVEVPKGYVLDESSVPKKSKTESSKTESSKTESIELRDVRWEVEPYQNLTRYRFTLDWQIFVAFETVKSTPLRTLELVFRKGDQSLNVSIPPDSVLVSNLLPPKMDAKHVQPYPDVAPTPVPLTKYWLGLAVALITLIVSLTYMAWFMGWISMPFEKRMPFRQAWRQIKSLPQQDIQSVPESLRILSKSLSDYAGYAVTSENLIRFGAEQTLIAPYLTDLTNMYQALQNTFFAGAKPSITLMEVKTLAKQLSHLEVS